MGEATLEACVTSLDVLPQRLTQGAPSDEDRSGWSAGGLDCFGGSMLESTSLIAVLVEVLR